jgi:hypothetical protein
MQKHLKVISKFVGLFVALTLVIVTVFIAVQPTQLLAMQ